MFVFVSSSYHLTLSYASTTANIHIVLKTQKTSHLNQATKKQILDKFSNPKKTTEMKISNPQKSFYHPRHLKSGAPSHWLLLIQRRQHFKS